MTLGWTLKQVECFRNFHEKVDLVTNNRKRKVLLAFCIGGNIVLSSSISLCPSQVLRSCGKTTPRKHYSMNRMPKKISIGVRVYKRKTETDRLKMKSALIQASRRFRLSESTGPERWSQWSLRRIHVWGRRGKWQMTIWQASPRKLRIERYRIR